MVLGARIRSTFGDPTKVLGVGCHGFRLSTGATDSPRSLRGLPIISTYPFPDMIVYRGVVANVDRGALRGSSGKGPRLMRLEMQRVPARR
jgi:hypothetical protein